MFKPYIGFIALIILVACNQGTPQPAVTSLSINTNPGSVSVGATLALSAQVEVQNGASKVIFWTSSNPSIASVNINSGLVRGEAAGTATITATSVFDSSKSSSVLIAVTGNTNITAVTISPRSATLPVNSTQLFSATVSGSGSFTQAVTWDSSDGTIAEVSSGGLVTAKAAGSATITATSVGDPSKKDSVSVSVIAATPLTFNPYQNLLAEINKPIAQTATVSGGTPPYKFAALTNLPAGLSLNPDSGAISGTPTVATPTTSYSIQVADSVGKTATATIVITVFVPTPTLTYTVFRALTAGWAITASNYTLTSTGLSGAITFSLNSGTLPPGITLGSNDGSLSGTPATAGTYNAVIRATDASNKTADGNLSLVVNPAPSFSPGYPAQIATVGVTFTGTTPTVTGGTAPRIFSASNLPAGLGIRASDGVINGIPTASSPATTYAVTVTDANGVIATTSVSITVNAGITLTYTLKRALTEGIAITSANYSRSISGGAPPYTYSVESSSLPAGIILNTNTGELGGSTTETGTFEAEISVTDSVGATGTGVLALVVNEPVQVQTDYTDPSNELTVGRPFTSSTPTLVGGTSPISYTASGLPSGLSINASNGEISGTPSGVKANSDYTVVAKDANGETENLTINLEVVAAPDLSYQSPETFTASSLAANQIISEPDINGGAGVLTYSRTSVSGPNFDQNLSFDSATGVVKNRATGTPAVGNYVMDIKVTDANGATDTFRLTIILTAD